MMRSGRGRGEGGVLTSSSPSLETVTLHRRFDLCWQGEKKYTKVTLCQLVINFQLNTGDENGLT